MDYESPRGRECASNGFCDFVTIRVMQIKPKHMEGLKLDAPSGSTSVSARMGSIDRKSTTYDVWSLGDDAESAAGAEEVKTLTYLAPRHKKRGKLYAGERNPFCVLRLYIETFLRHP